MAKSGEKHTEGKHKGTRLVLRYDLTKLRGENRILPKWKM